MLYLVSEFARQGEIFGTSAFLYSLSRLDSSSSSSFLFPAPYPQAQWLLIVMRWVSSATCPGGCARASSHLSFLFFVFSLRESKVAESEPWRIVGPSCN